MNRKSASCGGENKANSGESVSPLRRQGASRRSNRERADVGSTDPGAGCLDSRLRGNDRVVLVGPAFSGAGAARCAKQSQFAGGKAWAKSFAGKGL
jgi:hypothetical protein